MSVLLRLENVHYLSKCCVTKVFRSSWQYWLSVNYSILFYSLLFGLPENQLLTYLRILTVSIFPGEKWECERCMNVCICITDVSKLTNSMEQSPSLQANSHSASQEILRLLWNRRFTNVLKNKGIRFYNTLTLPSLTLRPGQGSPVRITAAEIKFIEQDWRMHMEGAKGYKEMWKNWILIKFYPLCQNEWMSTEIRETALSN
jgi:hypothetical protein